MAITIQHKPAHVLQKQLVKFLKGKIKDLGRRSTLEELRDSSADIDEIVTECGAQGEKDAYKEVLLFLNSK